VIVIDSSAWIEHFRATGSDLARAVERLLRGTAAIAITEVVLMEILAGANSDREAEVLRSRLLAVPLLPLRGLDSFEHAAALYRACAAAGERIRKTLDCLVAVPTIKAGATLLTADRDFEILARYTPLELEPV
jgi:predicted nucleic acid-binding protein